MKPAFEPVTTTMVALWNQYLPTVLGQTATNLFVRRTQKPKTWFVDEVIRPFLFREDEGTYIHVSDTHATPGRNHEWAEIIATHPGAAWDLGHDPLSVMTFFTNEMRIAAPVLDQDLVPSSVERPCERISAGQHHVFTFEFDVPEVGFLQQQISWITVRKNNLECPMGAFYKACSGHADFLGINVTYSGGKSLHIHVVFSMALARGKLELSRRAHDELRQGFALMWDRLHSLLLTHLDTGGRHADRSLRYPEQLRRLPGGIRVCDHSHLLGFPVGTEVRQVTLWEHSRTRASGDDLPVFLTPDAFVSIATQRAPNANTSLSRRNGPMSAMQEAYCANKLRALFSDWPRFANLEFQGRHYVANFFNSVDDHTPSSVMRDDHRTILLVGRDADVANAQSLPVPLGSLLTLWCDELADISGHLSGPLLPSGAQTTVLKLEQQFSETVKDRETAYEGIRTFFTATVCQHSLMLALGPEGIGKTTTLFKLYPNIARGLASKQESQLGMFAFGAYETAEEKCAKFNAEQHADFIGIVIPSFSRAYEEACAELSIQPITKIDAARAGYANVMAAITRLQPKVIQAFRKRHSAIWRKVGRKRPVFFSVHQVMHGWRTDSSTRLMWAPSYWEASDKHQLKECRHQLRLEMTLGFAVHDEVQAEHIVEQWPEELATWVERLVASEPDVWRKPHSIIGQFESYQRFRSSNGVPEIDGQHVAISFDDALKIDAFNDRPWRQDKTADTGEYRRSIMRSQDAGCHVDIYEVCHGRSWRIAERGWWDGLAHQTILLTTEQVPTALVQSTQSNWAVFKLEAPLAPRGVVDVHTDRSVIGAKLPQVCGEFRNLHPDYAIISNKIKMIADSVPHVTARGSNDLIDRNVMQTMTFLPPELYGRLQALNAWAGRS